MTPPTRGPQEEKRPLISTLTEKIGVFFFIIQVS